MKKKSTQRAMPNISKIIRALLFIMVMHYGERSMAQTGGALNFDGVDDYVSLPDTVVYGGPGWPELTIEAWINNTGSTSGAQAIVSSEGPGFVDLNTSSSGSISFYTDAGTFTFNALPVTTGWRQVSLVIKSGASAVYENGILVGTNTAIFNYVTNATQVDIGHGPDANDYFYGSIDEVRIWKRALSGCEVKAYMNCQVGSAVVNGVSLNGVFDLYRFNLGDAYSGGNPVETYVGGWSMGHTGKLHNFALTGSTSNWIEQGGVAAGTYCPIGLAEINVKTGSPLVTIPDGDNSANIYPGTNLGSVSISSSETYTYTIENNGRSQLNIAGITVVGDDNAAFVVSKVPAGIREGGLATFQITFTPAAPDRGYRAVVHIMSDDCDKGDYDFLISGRSSCKAPKTFITGNAALCAGGNTLLTANALAGAGTITSYQWFKRTGNTHILVGNGLTYLANEAGIYEVSVTNSYGCSEGSNVFRVAISPAITISASPDAIDAGASSTLRASAIIATSKTYDIALSDLVGMNNTCVGGNRFSSLTEAGFSWQDVSNGTVTGIQIQLSVGVNFIGSTPLSTGLNAGRAGAVISSPSGGGDCLSQSAFVTIDINPAEYIVNGTNQFLVTGLTSYWGLFRDNVNLNGFCARVTVNYLSPGDVSYAWMPGGMTEQNPVISPTSTTEYTVTATANGCSSTAKQVVTVAGSEPLCQVTCPDNISVNNDPGKCGAAVKFQAATTGSCGSLTYSPASGYLFPVGTTTVTVNSPSTGKSCSFTVTVTDNENPLITAPANVTAYANNANCSAKGVSLGNPITLDNCGVQPATNDGPSVYPLGTTTVTWTVKDINGHTATAKQTVTVTNTLSVSLSAGTISCYGSATTLTAKVAGSAGSLKYSVNGSAWQNSNMFTVGAGTFTVTVKDVNGSKGIKALTIKQPGVLTVSLAGKTNVSCYGTGNGSITVKANGGTQPYTYKKNTASSYQTSCTFNNLSPATYSINVKDKNGCTAVITGIHITQPSTALALALVKKTDVSCFNGSNGSIKVSANGGAGPYKYSLNNGSYGTTTTFSSLSARTYKVDAKDANGCVVSVSVVIKNGKGSCSLARDATLAEPVIEDEPLLEIKVLPNPSETDFTLQVKGNRKDPIEIRVINMPGQQVHHATGSANQSYHFGRGFVPGVYIVEILQGRMVRSIRVVKN